MTRYFFILLIEAYNVGKVFWIMIQKLKNTLKIHFSANLNRALEILKFNFRFASMGVY